MRNIMRRWVLASALGAVALTQASASIVFHFNTVHTGATPGGPAPWATMTITDIIGGGVQISLTNNATNPTGQFIGQLNLLFTLQPTGSNFSSDPYVQSISLGNFTDAGLGFNVKVAFKKPALQRLLPGGTSTFQLFGVSTANFVGANNSAMVHIQAIPPLGDSGKIIAPEPGSLIAIGTGLVSLLGLRRRKK